jgi:uncharacterized protein DUF5819
VAVPVESHAAGVKDFEHIDTETTILDGWRETPEYEGPSRFRGLLKAGLAAAISLLLTIALIHLLLVFLHVAPENPVSKRYGQQIESWVYPLFEQDWRLFAPNPESANRQISVRTMHTGPDGASHVSSWFDLTAVDYAAVEHNPFPSHANQNMLRRAWNSYLELHGEDDQSHSERALMMQKYLCNIAADRVTQHRHGDFEALQVRVKTIPVANVPQGDATPAPAPVNTRYLPWWKVSPHRY